MMEVSDKSKGFLLPVVKRSDLLSLIGKRKESLADWANKFPPGAIITTAANNAVSTIIFRFKKKKLD